MNQKALKTLEYNKILELLEGYATSTLGKDLCRNLKPLSNLVEIETMQQETADALSRIYKKGSLSFSGVKDIRGSLKRLEIGSTLGTGELLAVCNLLENTSAADNPNTAPAPARRPICFSIFFLSMGFALMVSFKNS